MADAQAGSESRESPSNIRPGGELSFFYHDLLGKQRSQRWAVLSRISKHCPPSSPWSTSSLWTQASSPLPGARSTWSSPARRFVKSDIRKHILRRWHCLGQPNQGLWYHPSEDFFTSILAEAGASVKSFLPRSIWSGLMEPPASPWHSSSRADLAFSFKAMASSLASVPLGLPWYSLSTCRT